jgi:hypothetical protein
MEDIMKFVYIIMSVVIITITFSGCTGNTTKNKVNSERSNNSASSMESSTVTASTATPTETSTSEASASSTNVSNIQEEVTIKASYEKPLSLKDMNTILLDGLQEGEEYIEVIVNGEIFDFEQVALSWNESKSELKEKETVKSIKKLENQTLVIKTYQPEGIPTEKIKWKSRTGKTYEYIISEKSLGDTDNSITKFEMK